jgi:ElaB/YqjD/DUF883 family membrane-anchored ribosome-binding protein
MAKLASKTEPTFDNLVGEFRALVDSMEDVLSAAAGDSGEKLTELKGKAEASLRKAKATLGNMERRAVAKTRKIASGSDGYVHENPWMAIAIGAGIGFLLGVLIGRK